MTEEQYQQLKQKIQEANPKFFERLVQVNMGAGREITVRDENVRLADVLLVMKEKYSVGRVGKKAYFSSTMEDISQGAYWKGWNLLKDDLSEQTDECKQFLFELLCV